MKQGLWLVLVLFHFQAFGQGQIYFGNSAATAITNAAYDIGRASTNTRVGLYVNANTTALGHHLEPGWIQAGGFTNLFSPGLFIGGNRTLNQFGGNFPAGTPVAVQVRAWLSSTYNYTSYEDAAIVADPNLVVGFSVVMLITPQNSPTPVPTLNGSGLQPFVLVYAVPEPSTIALVVAGTLILGVSARRRRAPPA